MSYLNTYPEKYNPSYDGHEVFLNKFFAIIRIFIRRFYSNLKKYIGIYCIYGFYLHQKYLLILIKSMRKVEINLWKR